MSIHARQQLRHLSEISTLLARFESVDTTVPEVLSLMARTLRLRGGTLISHREGRAHATFWTSEEQDASRARSPRDDTHARTAYGYLAGVSIPPAKNEEAVRSPTRPAVLGSEHLNVGGDPSARNDFVVLPLVVEGGRTFGALQIEPDLRLDETDLLFVNAVVAQLAIALDRQAVLTSKDAIADASRKYASRQFEELQRAERGQHFLADVSVLLVDSLDYQTLLGSALRAAVPLLADVCFFEEVDGKGTILPSAAIDTDRAPALATPTLRPAFGPEASMPSIEALLGWRQPREQVLATGEALILPDESSSDAMRVDQRARIKREAGVRALMVVPMVLRGKTLGTLTFAVAGPKRQYLRTDLELAQQLAHRMAVAVDHARLHRQLQKAVKARDDILGIVSHDLRSPLSTLLTSATLLGEELPVEVRSETTDKALGLISRSVARMERLIKDLLDVASIDQGQLSIHKQTHDLNLLVAEAIEANTAEAARKALQFHMRLNEPEIYVRCDRERILQVLGNLIGNAIKFTTHGGWIGLSADIRGAEACVAVSDTGLGIPKEQLALVFDRHWRANEAVSRGSGLGLYISRGILESHGGKLWVESEAGLGSTFFFALSLAEA